jgi:Potential Queuosine, Q, salvage protein family
VTANARPVDVRATLPPPAWGVAVDEQALDRVAQVLVNAALPEVGEGMSTLPVGDPPGRWCDFIGLSVSVLACLWAPVGDEQWTVVVNGETLTDAPAFFHAFARTMKPLRDRDGYDVAAFVDWSLEDAHAMFAGRGNFQLIPQRWAQMRETARTMVERYDGSFLALVEACEYDAERIVQTLVDLVPGYDDVAQSSLGLLRFEKLPRLATAMMASGLERPLTGLDDFPVYPDYMIPKVFRHWGIFRYDQALAATIDSRALVRKDSEWEHALRWATIATADRLRRRLGDLGRQITGPQLDFALWHAGVLGPEASTMGEHHRTLTLRY